MVKKIFLLAAVLAVFMAADAGADAGGHAFVDQVFKRTGTLCAEEDAQGLWLPAGDGIRAGINTHSFERIWLQIHIVCREMGRAKQVGSWVEMRDPRYGRFRAAPFKAGGDWVLIVHFDEADMLYAEMVPSGEEPEEDWTKPEEPWTRTVFLPVAFLKKYVTFFFENTYR